LRVALSQEGQFEAASSAFRRAMGLTSDRSHIRKRLQIFAKESEKISLLLDELYGSISIKNCRRYWTERNHAK